MTVRANARRIAIGGLLCGVALLGGCATRETTPPAPTTRNAEGVPDAVPRVEPRSKRGNPAFYEVAGRRYFVLKEADGYSERGIASWYGPGFHRATTATGETYDMYAMSAAHRTLPLPCYVRVTNLGNGRSVVVRVNDRGPFKGDRIIDLSYSAAAKLEMIRSGTAKVEVTVLSPGGEKARPPARSEQQPLFVQAGAFSDADNASRLRDSLRLEGDTKAFVRETSSNGKPLYQVRIGPILGMELFDRIVAQLKKLGIADARLALD
jgi:rare lipoprotein A